MKKPLIGVTPSPLDDDYLQGVVNCDYTSAVIAAGGIPVIVPLQCGDAADLLSRLEGLVLIGGGGDVGPLRYGDQVIHPATAAVHERRDELEIALVRVAVALDLPLLAFCRGSQILNVALGGTMYQDIPDQHGRDLEHAQAKLSISFAEPSHVVRVESGSLLERVYDSTLVEVNSDHHQASRTAAPELVASGHAPDGVIEAVERPASRFVLGLQWHPELMFRAHPEHLRPFTALVEAAHVHRLEMSRDSLAVDLPSA